jgi:hypothetical protein
MNDLIYISRDFCPGGFHIGGFYINRVFFLLFSSYFGSFF